MSLLKWLLLTTCVDSQRKSVRKFNLRPTCVIVWLRLKDITFFNGGRAKILKDRNNKGDANVNSTHHLFYGNYFYLRHI